MNTVLSIVENFFPSLRDNFKKTEFLEKTAATYKQLSGNTSELFTFIDDVHVKDVKFFKDLDFALRDVQGYSKGHPVVSLRELIAKVNADRPAIEKGADRIFSTTLMTESIDYAKLNMMYYINALSFFNSYLRYLAISVAAHARVREGLALNTYHRYSINYVTKKSNMDAFVRVATAFSKPASKLLENIKKLEGFDISTDLPEHALGLRPGSTDVLTAGFIPVPINPFFLIGKIWSNIEASDYERSKLEVQSLRIDILEIDKKMSGLVDKEEKVRLQKEMDYYNNRITKLTAEIRDYEEN